jgi:RNA polymerase sigma-70 factor, ECF subfamily
MVTGLLGKIGGFGIAGAVTESKRPSRLEEEVVSLFEQLRVPVLRYVLSLRIPGPDAEEIVQEVFLSLFRHLLRDKSRANLQGWVFRVAHNLALKQRTRSRRQAEHLSYLSSFSEIPGELEPGPEDRMNGIERQQRLLAVVRVLPEQDQFCLSLRAEGLRYREIAEVLGISLGSVANSLERSLSRLARAEDY